jgi:hypothetical protein
MSNNALRTLVGLSLVSALAISSHAQELTPDQRRFMGLPPSGPLTPQHSTVVAPQVESVPVLPTGQRASPGPAMTFRTVGTGGASCCEWIAADGVITIDTPQVFKEFLASLGKNGPTLQESITFNSPGGDFFAAGTRSRDSPVHPYVDGGWTDRAGGSRPGRRTSNIPHERRRLPLVLRARLHGR